MPDFKGLFSDPEFYQMSPEEQIEVYQHLAQQEPEMAAFSPEQHADFANTMVAQWRPGPPEINSAAMSFIESAIANQGMTPEDAARQQAVREVGRAVTGLIPDAISGLGQVPVIGEALRAPMTTLPGIGSTLAQGAASLASIPLQALAGAGEDTGSNLWRGARAGIRKMVDKDFAKLLKDGGDAFREAAVQQFGEPILAEGATIFDVSSPAQLADWVTRSGIQLMASAGPTIAATMIPGGGSLLGGALAASFATGETQQETGVEGPEAFIRGIPAATLDMIGAKGVVRGIKPKVGKHFTHFLNRMAGYANTTTPEIFTETAQQAATILNRRDVRGESLDPRDWRPEEWKELGEAALATAVGMTPFGIAGARNPTIAEFERFEEIKADIASKVKEALESPEQAAAAGDMTPFMVAEMRGIEPGEARHQAAPEYLSTSEAQAFIEGRPMNVQSIAKRLGRTEEEVAAELDAAAQQADALINPPRQPAQPTAEGEEVVSAVQAGLEKLAVEAEEAGATELAASYRERSGKVQFVEPDAPWERALVALAQSGSPVKVGLYTQPRGKAGELEHSGVFVRPGLIAVDVSNHALPRMVLGTLFHEMTHNQEAVAPEAYAGAVEALRSTPLWERSQRSLERQGVKVNDSEVMAHIMETGNAAVDVMYALANYADVEDMAKAPTRVRAVAELLAKAIRTVASKIGLLRNVEGMNLQDLKQVSSIFVDPEQKRSAAKSTLALLDMLRAPAEERLGNVPESFSIGLADLRAREPGSPRSIASAAFEAATYEDAYEAQETVSRAQAAMLPIGHPLRTAKEVDIQSDLRAREVVNKLEVLENSDLTEDGRAIAMFAQSIGAQVTFFRAPAELAGLGGFSARGGQVWVNVNNATNLKIRQIVAHELMHDFAKRDVQTFVSFAKTIKAKLPKEWADTQNRITSPGSGYTFDNQFDLIDETVAQILGENGDAFWSAVAEIAEEENAPYGFKRFLSWLGMVFRSGARGMKMLFNVRPGTPAEEIGRQAARLIAGLSRDGDYQVLDIEATSDDKKMLERYVAGKARSKKTPQKQKDYFSSLQFSTRALPPETPQGLGALRRAIEQSAQRGEAGKYWYEVGAKGIMEFVGGDIDEAVKFAKLLAIYSPQRVVSSNTQYALRAWGMYKAGLPRDEFMAQRAGIPEKAQEKAAAVLYDDVPWTGLKTNSFFNNIIALLSADPPQDVTVDVWMMRAFGFPKDAPTKAQYKAVSDEVRALAKKLGVEPWQAQAMVWVYTKHLWESIAGKVSKKAKKLGIPERMPVLKKDGTPRTYKGKVITKQTPEFAELYREMFMEARPKDLKGPPSKLSDSALLEYATALKQKAAILSAENIPGARSKALAGLHTADEGTRSEFHMRIDRALQTDDGYDAISRALGYGVIGDVRDMFMAPSAYVNSEGHLETNLATQVTIPTAAQRGTEASRRISGGSLDELKLYAAIRGILTAQEAMGGYRPFSNQGDHNGVVYSMPAPELARLIDDKVALYPTPDGTLAVNIGSRTNQEFRDYMKEIAGNPKYGLAVETFYIQEAEYGGIIDGHRDALRAVEDSVAGKLAAVYREFSDRGLGDVPQWVAEREREARDVRRSSHFWHFSVGDVSEGGILRERAGTGSAGQERRNFKYEGGKVIPESAFVSLYTNTAKAEARVVVKAKYVNKIIADIRLAAISSDAFAEAYRAADGSPEAFRAAIREAGYDGIVDDERGIVQLYRDVKPSEIVESREMTADEKKAWAGATPAEKIKGSAQYPALKTEIADLTRDEIEALAAHLTDDGVLHVPKGTDREALTAIFRNVDETTISLAARNPRRTKFSVRVGDPAIPPAGDPEVEIDPVLYSPGSSASWSLPKMNRWDRIRRIVQDSVLRLEQLNKTLRSQGAKVGNQVDIRLQEELYHGKAQEVAARIDMMYVQPIISRLRALSKSKGIDYKELLERYDEYLVARHAPERNKYIQEVWVNRKVELLKARLEKLTERIESLEKELAESTGELTTARLKGTIEFWKMKKVGIERAMIAVETQKKLNSGMSDEKAGQVMKAARIDGLISEFSKITHSYVDPMLRERLDRLLAEGMITRQEYDSVNIYKHYVPLKGVGAEGDIDDLLSTYHGFGPGGGFDIRGADLPFVTGREPGSEVNPVLAQAFVDALSAADRIERNRVAKSLLELAEKFPNQQLWEINKQVSKRVYDKKTATVKEAEDWWARNQLNVVAVKRGGDTYYITLKDAALVMAMKGLGTENLARWVRGLGSIMRTLAQLYTSWSSEFILTNFARDWQQSIVSLSSDLGKEAAAEVAKNSMRAVRGILAANFPNRFDSLKNEYTEYYHELKREGGKVGFFGMRGVTEMHESILSEMNHSGAAISWRAARKLGNYVASINEATENGIRLATYVAARRRGATKAESASLAKNVTVNFNRRGTAAGAFGAAYLFFNASVQGVDRFWKSLRTKNGQRLAAAFMAMGFMTSIWSRAVMGDDEDGEDRYDKVSEFTAGRNWIIGIPGADGTYITIPMPYGFGIFSQLGKELERIFSSEGERADAAGVAAVRMLEGLTSHFSPIGETSFGSGGYAMARPIVPTLAKPITDVLANETYWGGRIYPTPTPWDRRSSSHRIYEPNTLTEKAAAAVTQQLNRLTGGSTYRPGVVDINSAGLAYVLDSYIGPTGTFMRRPFDLAAKLSAGEDPTWNDFVIIRRFLAENNPMYYVPGEFYEAIDDVERAAAERDWMKENGESSDRWDARHGWKLSLEKKAREAQRDVREARDSGDREKALQIQRDFVKTYLQAEP